MLGTKDVTGDLWPLPRGRCLQRPKAVLFLAGIPGPCDSGSVHLSVNPPFRQLCWATILGGGLYVLLKPPYSPLALLTTRGMESSICLPGSPVRLGLIDWLLHFSVQHKDLHIQALSLYLLNAFIHVVAHLQIFIACSMADTVLGVEYLSKWAKMGRIVAVPSGCCPFVFLLKFILNLFHLVN